MCVEILKSIEKGDIKVCTSCLTFDEVSYIIKNYLEKPIYYETLNSLLVSSVKWLDVNFLIVQESVEFIKNFNLKPRDAIHIATMKLNKINTIISDDSDFDIIKNIKRIKITDFK